MPLALHRRNFLALSGAALVARNAWAADGAWARDFGKFVTDRLASVHAPGLSVAMVRGGRTVFSQGYGYRDVETARPVTADTVFQIASVSKTVTATAMMMLWQDGAFKLDDPVAPHLDFAVANPKFPDASITFRQLFTHTSSISDAVYDTLDFTGKDVPPLRDFLASYLAPGGTLFDAAKSYSVARPGTAWRYSNVAVALLGYLAGRVNREPLEAITQARLFTPLGMRRTTWRYGGVTDDRLAQPYSFENAHFRRLPRNAYPDWPAGLLCTSANDFAKFLAVYTQGGVVAGRAILEPKAIAAMLAPDPVLPDKDHPDIRQGLVWRMRVLDGHRIVSHAGGDPGAATVAAFDPDRRTGALAFANISAGDDFRPFQKEVIQRLLDKAAVM